MRSGLLLLAGAFAGWTSSVVYFVGQEERFTDKVNAEYDARRKAERERDDARNRALSRDVEIDRLRRIAIRNGMEWWRLPADDVERIPPQNFPTTPGDPPKE